VHRWTFSQHVADVPPQQWGATPGVEMTACRRDTRADVRNFGVRCWRSCLLAHRVTHTLLGKRAIQPVTGVHVSATLID
jgi:hypothetical protein